MIITRTPYRISFVGGGSDLAAFYTNSPGSVLSTAFTQYMYITVHTNFNGKEIKLKYNKTEIVSRVDDLEHPIVKAALKHMDIQGGIEITSVGDIPAQTGLGSSSSFTVGLLHALAAYKGIKKSPEDLAHEACYIEIETLREPIGKQDQYAAAYGGLNQFVFNSDNSVTTIPVSISKKNLKLMEQSLLLFFTGRTRKASNILTEQQKNIATDIKKKKTLQKMVDMVTPLKESLEKGNIASLGEYLHENWLLKKQLASTISDIQIDDLYTKARDAGAIGGKILGAGGGGFLLFYCPPEKQSNLINALGLKHQRIQFDFDGSRTVYIG